MKQIVSKKNLSMYTLTLDEEGTLQIQAPTLLKPLTLQAQQAQELALWLANAYQLATPQQPEQAAIPPDTNHASVAPAIQQSSAQTVKTTEQPQQIAQRVISTAISQARAQYPEVLAPENRDRFIDQILRSSEIKPLLSQNQLSRRQILLLVEQGLDR